MTHGPALAVEALGWPEAEALGRWDRDAGPSPGVPAGEVEQGLGRRLPGLETRTRRWRGGAVQRRRSAPLPLGPE